MLHVSTPGAPLPSRIHPESEALDQDAARGRRGSPTQEDTAYSAAATNALESGRPRVRALPEEDGRSVPENTRRDDLQNEFAFPKGSAMSHSMAHNAY